MLCPFFLFFFSIYRIKMFFKSFTAWCSTHIVETLTSRFLIRLLKPLSYCSSAEKILHNHISLQKQTHALNVIQLLKYHKSWEFDQNKDQWRVVIFLFPGILRQIYHLYSHSYQEWIINEKPCCKNWRVKTVLQF